MSEEGRKDEPEKTEETGAKEADSKEPEAEKSVGAGFTAAQDADAPSESKAEVEDPAKEEPKPEETGTPEATAIPHGHAHGHHGPLPGEEPRWLDDPANVKKLVHFAYGLCGFLVLSHILGLVGVYDLHGHYSWETWPGFYALYGFGAYMGLVVLAEVLRAAVQKSPTYYEAFDPEPVAPDPEDHHDHGHGHGDGGH